MPDESKDITSSGDELTGAAFVISDAAELIALAACCAAETQRLAAESLRACQDGKPLPQQVNEYAGVLHDLLAGRDFPVPIRPRDETKDFAMRGVELIRVERIRQIEEEGWTAEHDENHQEGELARAAAAYALHAPWIFPWD